MPEARGGVHTPLEGESKGLTAAKVHDALYAEAQKAGMLVSPESAEYLRGVGDTALAQMLAVQEGRKGAFMEAWPDIMRALRPLAPEGMLYVEAGGQQCCFTVDSVRRATGARVAAREVPDYVRGLLESGRTGRLLGYGRDEFARPPGMMVEIRRNGKPFAGFAGFPTEVETVPFAEARTEDFRRAFPEDTREYDIDEQRFTDGLESNYDGDGGSGGSE